MSHGYFSRPALSLVTCHVTENPPRRSPTVWVRASVITALDRLFDPGHRCCRLLSFAPRVSTESCHVRMNSCRERKRKVLKAMIGLFEAVWVCDLVSFLSFPRSAELQLSGINLAWNGVAGSALVSLWSVKDVFFWSYRFRKTTTTSPCRYLAESFPLQTGLGECIHFQFLPGTRSLNFSLDPLGYGACAAGSDLCSLCVCVRGCVHVCVCVSVTRKRRCQTNGKHDKRYQRCFT